MKRVSLIWKDVREYTKQDFRIIFRLRISRIILQIQHLGKDLKGISDRRLAKKSEFILFRLEQIRRDQKRSGQIENNKSKLS